jgi:AraC-like DNA-binding protein
MKDDFSGRVEAALRRVPKRSEPVDTERGVGAVGGGVLPGDCFVVCWPRAVQTKPTSHRRAQLNVCLRGEFTMALKDRLLTLRAGQAALVPPYEFHHYGRFEGAAEGGVLWAAVYFDEADASVARALAGRVATLTEEAWRRFGEVIAAYREGVAGGDGDGRAGEAGAWVDLLLRELARNVGRAGGRRAKVSAGAPAAVQAAIKHVHANLHGPLDVGAVARAAGVSESHLRRLTGAALGMGLGEFVRRSRLTRAAAMLQQADAPRVGEVAEACGFSSVFAFSRAFRAAQGVSPRAFQRATRVCAASAAEAVARAVSRRGAGGTA